MYLAVFLEMELSTACDIEHYHVIAAYCTGIDRLHQTGQGRT